MRDTEETRATKPKKFDFTSRYVFALSLIALLSFLAFLNLNNLIVKQVDYAKIINISGRQRMLSQQVALFSIYYKTKALHHAVEEMEQAHRFLTTLPDMPEEVKNIFFERPVQLDERVRTFLRHARHFAETRSGKSLSYVLEHSLPLLKDLEKVVNLFQKESERKTDELQRNERIILLLTLLTLLGEALFIFKPINDEIRRRTEALIQEKTYAETITESNPTAIISVGEDRRIHRFNRHAEKIFGFKREEILGPVERLRLIIPESLQEQHEQGLKNFFERGKLQREGTFHEFEGRRKNGEIFPLRISFGHSVLPDGKRIVVASIADISEEREMQRMVQHQSRIAALGEMIGNIAHQWRQPLSAIKTVASGLRLRKKAGLLKEEEIDKELAKIGEYVDYLSHTIDDFRSFFRNDEYRAPFTIREVVEKAISLSDASLKHHGIRIELDIPEKEKTECHGFPNELTQVLLNLISNAKDAYLAHPRQPKIILVTVKGGGEGFQIEFCDNAGGIDESILVKIFDPYFTTKHQSQGTGMGLYMSQQIVSRRFSGTIRVKNRSFQWHGKECHGACFILDIPCCKA